MTPNITPEALERAVNAVCAQWNMHRPDAKRVLVTALPSCWRRSRHHEVADDLPESFS